mgnify:FL=1
MSKNIDKQIIKERIKNYISKIEGEFYPDEIADKLDIDFELVMSITEELINEQFIEEKK